MPHNKATLLFNEAQYLNKSWNIILFSGFPNTLPTIRYYNHRENYKIQTPEVEDIAKFIQDIYEKVRPPLECIMAAFIYIERLMVFHYIYTS